MAPEGCKESLAETAGIPSKRGKLTYDLAVRRRSPPIRIVMYLNLQAFLLTCSGAAQHGNFEAHSAGNSKTLFLSSDSLEDNPLRIIDRHAYL
jgi:hypothetical protein